MNKYRRLKEQIILKERIIRENIKDIVKPDNVETYYRGKLSSYQELLHYINFIENSNLKEV